MGRTMFALDACVSILSLLTYLSYKEAMYTLVAVFVAARLIDFILEGGYAAKGATIISSNNDLIQKKILVDMERGVTI
ncbi:YitT family protein, partial [Bacillus spizizenii]|uniref:YitT family protein n=1 Tax=Bacillus spizizenii TaxID=96241 RepID=UPI001F60BA8D